VDGVFRWRSG